MPSLPLLISWRFLWSKKQMGFVSFTSLIAILGISFGIFALIVVISVMNGLQEDLRSRLLRTTPSIRIQYPKHKPIKNHRAVIERLGKDKRIKEIRSEYASKALLSAGKFASGALLRGVQEKQIKSRYEGFIHSGHISLSPIKSMGKIFYPIVLGIHLATRLHLSIGQKLTVTHVKELLPGADRLYPRQVSFFLVGTLKSGLPAFDAAAAFTSLSGMRYWLREDSEVVSDILVELHDIYKAQLIAKQMRKYLKDPQLDVLNWIDENKQLFASLKREKIAIFIILALIILIASFNIVSTILLFIAEKEVGIAILVTMGVTKRQLRRVFVYIGSILGLLGVLLGTAVGIVGVFILKTYRISIPGNLFPFKYIPVSFYPSDLGIVVVGIFLFTIIIALIPLTRLKYVNPIKTIYNRK